MANAARLGAMTAAGLLVAAIAGLVLFGQLDDVARLGTHKLSVRLADMGFAVRSIDVTGAEDGVAHDIVLATEIYDGQSIFAIDPDLVRARVEALPSIRSATVARLWPDRISIVVETREAFALWQVEGALNVIDRDGVVISAADPMAPPALPLVVAEGANETVVEIIEALALYPTIRSHVVGAVRVGDRRWNLRLDTGADVKLPEGDVQASMAILARLQDERGILRLAAESFDLRGQGDLIVRALPDRAAAAGMREHEA